jgi:hypothetical protein
MTADGAGGALRRLEVLEAVEGGRAPSVGQGRPIPDERQRSGGRPDDPVYRGYGIVDLMPAPFRTDDDMFDAIREHFGARRTADATA